MSNTTSRHTTVVEADVTHALASEGRLQAATVARMEASRRLADELDDAEKARIATLLHSETAAKRMAGARRDEIRQAKQAIAAAKDEENAIKQTVVAEKSREAAMRRTAGGA
jgi:F0F1-type ATP synthase membrane subunit b/b'